MNRGRDSSGRLPFDPGRVKAGAGGADTPPAKSNASVITVSELTRMVKGALASAMPGTLSVVGEISNLSRPAGGHLYFTLKDAASELRCVMWRSSAGDVKFKPVDGMEIVATGSVDVYEPRGQYQFYARRLEPRGVGALELAFQQRKEKLGKEGLFDPARKRPLPAFPRRIAVITSTTGAAVRDILQTIARRCPVVEVLVFGVRVQGDGAADEIADAIRRINASSERLGGVDVLIVGRGGGSLEDLWAFNEEAVARAIYQSTIPVVSAVGHEVDFSIADFVADVRAATPTAAAELVVPMLADVLDGLDALGQRLRRSTSRIVNDCRARLAVLQKAEWFRDPVGRIHQYQQQIDEVVGRLRLAESRLFAARRTTLHQMEMRLSRVRPEAQLARRRERLARIEQRLTIAAITNLRREDSRWCDLAGRLLSVSPIAAVERHRIALTQYLHRLSRGAQRAHADAARWLETLEKRLQAGSHEAVLKRGFSITRRIRGRAVVRSAKEVREGDRLETQTADGVITSRVSDANQAELFE
ncbi:MAG: exodeoxyribonuclease VII large subunit [Planctomycetes bacterium]|nr:exodeoxyribonuclease VII large subunit [Planctomycetota bacterium]